MKSELASVEEAAEAVVALDVAVAGLAIATIVVVVGIVEVAVVVEEMAKRRTGCP